MKKTLLFLMIVVLAFSVVFVSCKSEPAAPAEDGAIHVSNFAQFKTAVVSAKKTESKTIVFDKDLTWDGDTYNKENAYSPDLTGLTIDMNNHSITGIISTAFAPTGDSFTFKNGTISLVEATNTYQKAIMIGFAEKTTNKDYTTEAEQAKAVTFDSVVINGAVYLGDGVFVFNNCSIIGAEAKNNRGLVCYSGHVTLNGTTVRSRKSGTDAAEVAIYVQETVLKLNNGTVIDSANHGIQAYNNSSVITSGTVTISAAGNFAIYTNYVKVKSSDEDKYTRADGKYKNVVTLGSGTTVTSCEKGVLAMTFGDVYTIESGVSLTGPGGTAEPKYGATSVTAAVGTANTNGYIGWSAGKGSDLGAATLTDNRT